MLHTISFLLMTLVMFTAYPLKAVDTIAAIMAPAVGSEANGDENQE
jgi:hypothetical protein